MGSCVTRIDGSSLLGTGEKMIRGTFLMSSTYATGGDTLDLSNHLKASGYPTVTCDGGAGYVAQHNKGTAAAGKVLLYQNVLNTNTMNGVDLNTPLYQVHSGADLSAINVGFYAIGPAR